MKTKLLTILLLLITTLTFGQLQKIFAIDFDSQYDGGEKAFIRFLRSNLKYPQAALENDRQGLVIIGFTLTKNNKITDIIVKNSVGMGCDEETIRLLKAT